MFLEYLNIRIFSDARVTRAIKFDYGRTWCIVQPNVDFLVAEIFTFCTHLRALDRISIECKCKLVDFHSTMTRNQSPKVTRCSRRKIEIEKVQSTVKNREENQLFFNSSIANLSLLRCSSVRFQLSILLNFSFVHVIFGECRRSTKSCCAEVHDFE